MLYLSQSRKDSSDCASETTGTQADGMDALARWLMVWLRRQCSGHHLPGIIAVGAPVLAWQHIIALNSTASNWIKLNIKTRMLGNKTMRSLLCFCRRAETIMMSKGKWKIHET